jgi:peptide chain release factor
MERMARLGVREADLEESFTCSGGPGGQNVNKTSTCVRLVHRPTGIEVRCQTSRYQGRNRVEARRQLLEKLEAMRARRAAEKRAAVEKLRRQRRPRSRGAKERILADKARRSVRKADRRSVAND